MNCDYKEKILEYYEIRSIKDCMMDIALYNIDGMSFEEAKHYLEYDANPSVGSVSGLIYYSETEPIAYVFYDEIMELINECYGNEIPYQLVSKLNNITWFAWENYIGDDDFIEDVLEKALELKLIYLKEDDEDVDDDENIEYVKDEHTGRIIDIKK